MRFVLLSDSPFNDASPAGGNFVASGAVPPSWLQTAADLAVSDYEGQESNTVYADQDDDWKMEVDVSVGALPTMLGIGAAHDAAADKFDAPRHSGEWALPSADADWGLEEYQPGAGFLLAFTSDLSDLFHF